jgi:hypothetical protein
MGLLITPDGQVERIYDERLSLEALGRATIRRQSQVDWYGGGWWALVVHPDNLRYERLGPFAQRSEALAAEIQWLERAMEERHQCQPSESPGFRTATAPPT